MPRPNAVVGDVRDVAAGPGPSETAAAGAPQEHVTVTFSGGQRGVLNLADNRSRVWRDVLQSLHAAGQPAYVEVDPASGLITEVLLPVRFKVTGLTPVRDGLEVELTISHARHHLRRSNPDFDELQRLLEEALERETFVLVTETLDEHEIIDVRPLDEPAAAQG